jgi:UDP-N-acetylglucosamine/UDP-N-acetylgalactosamine diphosphorylase
MTFEQACKRLEPEGQHQLLNGWDRLDDEARSDLLGQIAALDFGIIRTMRAQLDGRQAAVTSSASEPEPAAVVEMRPHERAQATERGEAALRAGQVGVLLVAGGQGSRLGYEGPKGAFPIGPVSNAVLFYFHARKILSLTRSYGATVPFYIMTSETNDAATRDCFAENGWFGLAPEDVFFFKQGMWPSLDDTGRIIRDAPGHIFKSPDGHGGTLSALQSSGGLADMARRGLKTVFYFQVDNPLVEIADPAFIGLHLLKGTDLSIKVCAKRDPSEGLGMVVQRDGRCEMVEYTEFTDAQKNRRKADGELYFKYGSVAIHLFQLDFLQREASVELPMHIAHKKIAVCGDDGTVTTPKAPNGYKFEKFIFDLLPHANSVLNVAFDRAEEFSPVKNATGADSPETCKRDLIAKWGRWFAEVGIAIPRDGAGHPAIPIEIDPAYARTPELLKVRLGAGCKLDDQQAIWLKQI